VAYLDYAETKRSTGNSSAAGRFPANILVSFHTAFPKAIHVRHEERSYDLHDSEKEIAMNLKLSAASRAENLSNCNRAAMATLLKQYADEALLAKVTHESRSIVKCWLKEPYLCQGSKRSRFENSAIEAGFFVTVPCENADEVGLPFRRKGSLRSGGKGLRVFHRFYF